MIALHGVYKAIGGQPALHDVSLNLAGGIVALVGANGSGKTTLLRLLATLIRPDAGQMLFDGLDYAVQRRTLRQSIGYLPQHIELPSSLTSRVLLRHLAQLRRIPDVSRVETLLLQLNLSATADKPLNGLSSGQTRLVCIAQALLSRPELLILDEVFSGLGILERQAVVRALTVENHAHLTVFSTHELADVERIASHVVILKQGRALYCGPVTTLCRAFPNLAFEQIYAHLIAQEN